MPAILPLSDHAILSLSGTDKLQLLQGLLTINVHPSNNGSLAALCNVKGRVIATCRVLFPAQHDAVWLFTLKDVMPLLTRHITRHILLSDVQCSVQADPIYAIMGDAPHDLPISGPSFMLSPHQQLLIGPQPQLSCTHPSTYWHKQAILAGEAWINHKTSGLFTPHMLSYPKMGWVAFDKGCYLGQEVITRIEHLGKNKRCLLRANWQGTPLPQCADTLTPSNEPPLSVVDVYHDTDETLVLLCGKHTSNNPWERIPSIHNLQTI